MRMKLIWLPCLVFFFGVLCTSCGSDNNEPTDEPGTGDAGGTGDTEVKGDYIASTKVKTVVLKSEWNGIVLIYLFVMRILIVNIVCFLMLESFAYFLLYVNMVSGLRGPLLTVMRVFI